MALNARWGGGVNFLTPCTPTTFAFQLEQQTFLKRIEGLGKLCSLQLFMFQLQCVQGMLFTANMMHLMVCGHAKDHGEHRVLNKPDFTTAKSHYGFDARQRQQVASKHYRSVPCMLSVNCKLESYGGSSFLCDIYKIFPRKSGSDEALKTGEIWRDSSPM